MTCCPEHPLLRESRAHALAGRQPPAGEGQAKLLPHGRGRDEAPGPEEGRPWSGGSRRGTHRSSEVGSPLDHFGFREALFRPSARSRGAGSCEPSPPPAGALPGPAISRPSRTSGGATAPRGRSVPAALEAPGPGSSRPPGRMLAASFQVGPRHVGGRGLTDWRSTIIGCDPLGAPAAKPPEEATNRRATQPK